MMELILRRGVLNNLIASAFIGAALWVLATPIDKIKAATAAIIENFIAVQYDNHFQENMTSRTILDVSMDGKLAGRVIISLLEIIYQKLSRLLWYSLQVSLASDTTQVSVGKFPSTWLQSEIKDFFVATPLAQTSRTI